MKKLTRRDFTASGLGALATLSASPGLAAQLLIQPRMRVIIDNDFSGDPDDLFQLAHHLLSPSVDIRLIVGSHLGIKDPFDPSTTQAANAVARAKEILSLFPSRPATKVVQGAEMAIRPGTPYPPSKAVEAIIAEAMHHDQKMPLYYCAGGGLTDLAMAWKAEPAISKNMILTWIGGPEYPDLVDPSNIIPDIDYNLNIDIKSAQIIFNESDFQIWQIPRDTYRKMLISHTEITERIRPAGRVGRFLADHVDNVIELAGHYGFNLGETYVLGDSPLVTLTALQSPFQPDPASSRYVTRAAPRINDDGTYGPPSTSKKIRVYRDIDQRLTFDDLMEKLLIYGRS
ncbi:nucleoside hydrolase [Sphingomonas abietis]|uniref:Nucleoside hydrolase n=1 Tax=Sphingomonas abietis TaxID=3012344 RepID=A0ABY7NN06_9SPHN|nr:nucleoside hydrolase [Sphingomonas abietis]WBO21967.1 nucleoside hydrolase [Sphingomonas abietis]